MVDHITNRSKLLRDLRRELVGPDPAPLGKELDLKHTPTFNSFQELHAPWVEKETNAEVISRDTPTKRYGVGVLYPPQQAAALVGEPVLTGEAVALESEGELASGAGILLPDLGGNTQSTAISADPSRERREKAVSAIAGRAGRRGAPGEDDGAAEFDVSGANSYRPSAMAVSFLVALPEDSKLIVRLPPVLPESHHFSGMGVNGRYEQIKADLLSKGKEGATKTRREAVWVRRQVALGFEVPAADLLGTSRKLLKLSPGADEGAGQLVLSLEILSRPRPAGEPINHRLLTVNLVNRADQSKWGSRPDAYCLFQAYFEVEVLGPNGQLVPAVLPYPTPSHEDMEVQSNALLYRNLPAFASGHGCAADWAGTYEGCATTVRAECMPVHELPSITPDITRENGEPLSVPMRGLAGLDQNFDILGSLYDICNLYERWIADRELEMTTFDSRYQLTAVRHMKACRDALKRMKQGTMYLRDDPMALQAFKWANETVLLQQIRGDLDYRAGNYNEAATRVEFKPDYSPVNNQPEGSRGNWRAFQIAFLLLAIRSAAEKDDPERDVADLIWFPTGGGKTEAYLGLTAFSLFMRRLRNPKDSGVHVLMRYTLRLLTAQQFQRATGLVCSMDYVRRQNEAQLGTIPFSGGIWLGGSTTPNKRDVARSALRELVKGDAYAENPFMLTKCPWCGAQMGLLKSYDQPDNTAKNTNVRNRGGKRGKSKYQTGGKPNVIGYEDDGRTVRFECPDSQCDFSRNRGGLPVYVIDQDIYEACPSLVIGTVDKFAMLAWNPEARSMFGLDSNGNRIHSPPGLIIQDELHLISGPLGSMSGLYEPIIEELCTDHRSGQSVKPKLVCSTATIRAFGEQILALYGREQAALFPPPGLDIADAFFSRYARDKDDPTKLAHGRMYVGINGPGHGSLQTTQVRTFTALLQSPYPLSEEERDPWWTLLVFFNSLRELGTTLTLFQSDIPDYLRVMRSRYGLDFKDLRSLWNIKELTGRLNSEEVPRAIQDLERRCGNPEKAYPIDVCLASNIIEVGIDIGRLSVMAIVGQPKTTAQYIQVSGRVGRIWWERPGLVVMIYNASKPRDRSHFEKFRSYHQQLYAQVEPTSVTPFSPQALDRALHAVMAAYVRQYGVHNQRSGPADVPNPFPQDLVDRFGDVMRARVATVNSEEGANFSQKLQRLALEWQAWQHQKYKAEAGAQDPGLLTPAGAHIDPAARKRTWMTPQSMRSVDAECQAEITSIYISDQLRGLDA